MPRKLLWRLLVGLLRLSGRLEEVHSLTILLGGEGHGLQLLHPLLTDLDSLVLLSLAFDTVALLMSMGHDLFQIIRVDGVEHTIQMG